MTKKSLALSKVYQLLEPGPVVMVTTSLKGTPNVMTMSWHMMVDFEPPIVGCVISNRNHTFTAITKTKECVLNIPTVELTKEVVGVGNTTGSKVNKFEKFHLLTEGAEYVQAPLLRGCYASLECRVIDTKMANKYNIFILEVLKAWIRPTKEKPRMIHHCGNGVFTVDGDVVKEPSGKK